MHYAALLHWVVSCATWHCYMALLHCTGTLLYHIALCHVQHYTLCCAAVHAGAVDLCLQVRQKLQQIVLSAESCRVCI